MNGDQLIVKITRKPILVLIVIGVGVLIYLHPEWINGAFREDLTAWDIVLGLVEAGVVCAGAYALILGVVGRDRLIGLIGFVVASGGLLLWWFTFG